MLNNVIYKMCFIKRSPVRMTRKTSLGTHHTRIYEKLLILVFMLKDLLKLTDSITQYDLSSLSPNKIVIFHSNYSLH